MDQCTVLIVTDEAEFSAAITGRWQTERQVPAFTLMGSDLCRELSPDTFDLAIVGAVGKELLPPIVQTLDETGNPVIYIHDDRVYDDRVRDDRTVQTGEVNSHTIALRKNEGWLDALVLVATEVLRRTQATARARHTEQANAVLQHQALLGRYMLDMRHTMNNALTSVLGNSELLMLEPGMLSATARAQVETIRNMAMRMNEILQRFSSIDTELKVVEQQSAKENRNNKQVAAAGLS